MKLFWMGSPGSVGINHRFTPLRAGRGARLVTSASYKAGVAAMAEAFRTQREERSFSGPVEVHVCSFWFRQHRTGGAAGLALGDVDAPLKAVYDALEKSGVVTNDGQVLRTVASKALADGQINERIEVSIMEASA
jgi:Holliday junction resolvase RusA-like endonuclease